MKDADCVEFLRWALPRLQMRWPGFRKPRGQVCKRISRRMAELGIGGVGSYREYLAEHPEEWEELDDLCRVTISRFYRDRGVWRLLQGEVLPELAETARRGRVAVGEEAPGEDPPGPGTGRPENGRNGGAGEAGILRAWSAGCGSGEEPYTLSLVWWLGSSPPEDGGRKLSPPATPARGRGASRGGGSGAPAGPGVPDAPAGNGAADPPASDGASDTPAGTSAADPPAGDGAARPTLSRRYPEVELLVTATDAEPAVLERARVGTYDPGTLRELPEEWIETGFRSTERGLVLRPRFRRGISFSRADIRGPMPGGPFHLVLCRNLVFTYFAKDLQARILAGILERMTPRGVLVLGSHEELPPGAWSLERMRKGEPVFRRILPQTEWSPT